MAAEQLSLSHGDVLEEMKHRLRDIPTGDFRGKLRYYPDYYLKEKKILGVSNDNGNDNAGSSSVPASGTGEGSSAPQPATNSRSSTPFSDPLPLRPHPDAAAPEAGSKRKPSPRRTPSQPLAKKRRPISRSGRGTPSPL
jgi:hypothetical protein